MLASEAALQQQVRPEQHLVQPEQLERQVQQEQQVQLEQQVQWHMLLQDPPNSFCRRCAVNVVIKLRPRLATVKNGRFEALP